MGYNKIKVRIPEVTGNISISINGQSPDKTSFTVTKNWVDNGTNRPSSVDVQLYKDGVVEGNVVTLNSANNWTYTWTNLDKYDNDQLITYTVDEPTVPTGYTKTVSGSIITNTKTAVDNLVKFNTTGEPDIDVGLWLKGYGISSSAGTLRTSTSSDMTNAIYVENGDVIRVKYVDLTTSNIIMKVFESEATNIAGVNFTKSTATHTNNISTFTITALPDNNHHYLRFLVPHANCDGYSTSPETFYNKVFITRNQEIPDDV